jgi:hypothetical protein
MASYDVANDVCQAVSGGTGAGAQFYRPWGIAVDGDGNVFVADRGNHCIRQVTPEGDVTTAGASTRPLLSST